MVIARYIFHAGTVELYAAGLRETREQWIGVEIASPIPVDLERFSRELGYDLIGADGMTEAELASVGITRFERVILDGRYVPDA